jgi:Txe/YoeB family toxin of Txe-Axe toxin-antitoxin module
MIDKKLEQKLEQFLKENNRQYYKGSIKYLGLREGGTIDRKIKNLHIVSYMVSISDQPYDGDAFFSARFDEKDYRLIDIVGPQSWENFE